jgi:hypothetical protein
MGTRSEYIKQAVDRGLTTLRLKYIMFKNVTWVNTKFLACKPEQQTQPGKPTCKQKDNIEADLEETGWDSINWSYVAQH